MCEIVTLTALALGTAQAGMSFVGQQQQAKTQEKMQKRASAAEQQRHLTEMSAMRLRERQEKVAAAQRIQQSTTKAREARATARVSAGESGVAGLSVDALINDLTRKEAEFSFSVQQQMQFSDMNRQLGFDDGANRSRMNLLSINRPINQPNLLGSIIEGATTGLSAYSSMSSAGVGQGAKAASTSTAPAFKASSAFNVSPSNYTPFKAPTTF